MPTNPLAMRLGFDELLQSSTKLGAARRALLKGISELDQNVPDHIATLRVLTVVDDRLKRASRDVIEAAVELKVLTEHGPI